MSATTSSYAVKGMTCGHCASAVTTELQKLKGVLDVQVDLDRGTVEVRSDAPLPRPAVAGAIDEAGYELLDPKG